MPGTGYAIKLLAIGEELQGAGAQTPDADSADPSPRLCPERK